MGPGGHNDCLETPRMLAEVLGAVTLMVSLVPRATKAWDVPGTRTTALSLPTLPPGDPSSGFPMTWSHEPYPWCPRAAPRTDAGRASLSLALSFFAASDPGFLSLCFPWDSSSFSLTPELNVSSQQVPTHPQAHPWGVVLTG